MDIEHIKNSIRNVPDFPKAGIQFKDITPILQNHLEFLEKGGVFLIPLPNLKVIGQP